MGSTFNPQILVDKLAKLNNSQQSIETLSHWCIFHMNKAKNVVDTWERQFHCSPSEQRIAYLYLANDILQNSRKKGAEFVAEFWRVLPEALRDVIRNGDDFARNAALRLINIWDERKVFGSRGHILKEEFMGRLPESNNKSAKQLSTTKIRPVGNTLDKVVSDYEVLYGGQLDEDTLVNKCSSTISTLEKVVKDIGGSTISGKVNEPGFGEKLKGQHASLKECIDQLAAFEASRMSLVSHLKEAIQEQESKLEQVRGQLRAAQLQSEQVTNLCQQLVSSDNISLSNEQGLKESYPSAVPPVERQMSPVVYTRQVPLSEESVASEDDSRKSAAAAVAAKLAASTASAEMLSHVFTSLVSGGIISNSSKEPLSDHAQSEKRLKIENGAPTPLFPFSHPDSLQQNANANPTNQQPPHGEQPTPASSSLALPSFPPTSLYPISPQFIQSAGSMSNVAYSYGATQQPGPGHMPGFPSLGAPVMGMSPYAAPVPSSQGFEGGFYSPSSSVHMPPTSRQQN